jgi:hypothetical protein
MFGADFVEKCIIVQFLDGEKDGKAKISQRSPEASGAEFAEKTQRKTKNVRAPEGGPYEAIF